MKRAKIATLLVGLLLVSPRPAPSFDIQSTSGPKPPSPGVCEREWRPFVGEKPQRPDTRTSRPKKVHNVVPDYPKLPEGTSVRAGAWVGEVLIDANGTVAHVWPTREVRFSPRFPAFNQAIVDAVRQWRFEPLRVANNAVPVCMSVSISINWS